MTIEAMKQALDALELYQSKSSVQMFDVAAKGLRAAIEQAEKQEPDIHHQKVQAIIGARARLQIEMRLVEQLLDDPDFETTASDMEYWGPLHDRLKARLKERNA